MKIFLGEKVQQRGLDEDQALYTSGKMSGE